MPSLKTLSKQSISALVLAAVLILSGCNRGDDSSAEQGAEQTSSGVEESGQATPESATSDDASITASMRAFQDNGEVVELEIEGNDRLQFNKEQLKVGAGQMVRLTLKHTGVLPAQAMGHNVVILKSDEEVYEFGADVGENGGSLSNDYVPVSLRDRVIAFTDLIGGGSSTTVEFQAPSEPGEYPFLCSFPGHFGQMNGVFLVE